MTKQQTAIGAYHERWTGDISWFSSVIDSNNSYNTVLYNGTNCGVTVMKILVLLGLLWVCGTHASTYQTCVTVGNIVTCITTGDDHGR